MKPWHVIAIIAVAATATFVGNVASTVYLEHRK